MDYIDLSYYKELPLQFSSQPKVLINEITNEIEYLACVDSYSSSIDYASSQLFHLCGIKCQPVMWAEGFEDLDNFLTVSEFNLSKNWVKYADDDKILNVKNKSEFDFCFITSSLLGGSCFSEDYCGYIDNNKFIKSFNYLDMFEIELAMYMSGNTKRMPEFERSIVDIFEDDSQETMESIKPFVDNLMKIKKSQWFEILNFPPSPHFEKSKFWVIKKFQNLQKVFKEYYK